MKIALFMIVWYLFVNGVLCAERLLQLNEVCDINKENTQEMACQLCFIPCLMSRMEIMHQ